MTTLNAARPLPRRATDRVEHVVAWLMVAAGLLVVLVAGLTGMGIHHRGVASVHTMTPARAVLLEDATITATRHADMRPPISVPARWVDRDGTWHDGEIRVKDPAPAATEVAVWVDGDGTAATESMIRDRAVATAVVTAAGILLAGGAVPLTVWFAVRRATAARNARRWEREWALVGPAWTGRPGY